MMTLLKRVLGLLCLTGGLAFGAQTLSPAQFTAKYVAVITAKSSGTEVSVASDLVLTVKSDGSGEHSLLLDNAYQQYRQDPQALDEILQRYVTAALASIAHNAIEKIDSANVVSIIKDRAWLADVEKTLKERGATETPNHVYEEFNSELIVLYAEDAPTSLRYLTEKSLKESGLKKEALAPLAKANLKRILPRMEIHKGPQIAMVVAGGNFEASILTLDDVWDSSKFGFEGDLVVAVPARDLLLVTGSKTPGGIARLRGVAAKAYREATYRLTEALFIRQGGKFVRLD